MACAFALAVMFGLWLENWPWLIVPVLTLVAMLATWLCNAVRLGPPGAYMFVLVCAAGTALPAEHIEVWQAGALVLGGGAGAWVLHTVGVLIQLRGPERQAVAAAGRAVVAWLQASSAQHVSRHAAARALQDSWQMLVGFQPIPARPGGELERLRAVNRELHLLFASTLAACWDTERNLCEGDDERTPIVHLRADDMPQVNRAIEALSQSLSCLTPPPVLGPLPELLHADLTDLHGFVLRQLPALRDHVSSRRPPR